MKYLRFILIPAVLFLLPEFTQAGWVRQTSGINVGLHSINFPKNSQTGYIVGEYGDILKTTNGGSLWILQGASTNATLYSVHFPVDDQTGYAAGGSGSVFKTTDGGATWIQKRSGSSTLYSIYFPVDAQTGYTVGYPGFIIKTTDGGETWATLQLDSLRILHSVYFPMGTLTGYVAGYQMSRSRPPLPFGIIMKTTDGGISWTTSQVSPFKSISSVHFVLGGQTGYYVGESSSMAKTTDAGVNWVGIVPGTTVNLYSVHFPADARIGYTVGEVGTILKTTDWGATWGQQSSGVSNSLSSVQFNYNPIMGNRDTGYCVGDSGIILKTTDGGGTFVEEEGRYGLRIMNYGVTATPNPFISFTKIPGYEAEHFALYDIAGRRVGTYKGSQVGGNLRPGVYFIRSLEGKTGLVRIVKIR